MQTFQIHTLESAPEQSQPALQGLKQNFGFIPNAAATMAGSPALINSFVACFGSFHGGSFSESERQILLLSNAVALKCHWTVAFHSAVALKAGVTASDVTAVRHGNAPAERKLAALSRLAKAMIERQGRAAGEIDEFVAAGYAPAQVLEIIAAIAISTMAALTTTMADTPLEDPFKPQAWQAA